MKTIAIINQKGGVGKTTTTINLAHALALRGRKVVLIDLDPQGQLGTSLGLSRHDLSGIDDVLLKGDNIADKLIPVRDGIGLIPSGCELIQMEQLAEGGVGRGHRLRLALEQQFTDQDYLLVDCPPASGVLATNALFAASDAVLPVAGDFLSLHGLSAISTLIERLGKRLGRSIRQRIVLTRFHPGRRLSRQAMESLLLRFPDKLLATPIRETAALAESPGYGQTIFEYEPESNGAQDYAALAGDLLEDRIMS